MFGWFKPVCPIELAEKVWVEQRLAWLIERFGSNRILNVRRVLPTTEFFPDPYHGMLDDVPPLFNRVCGFMDVDPDRFHVGFFGEADRHGAAGLYYRQEEKPVVRLSESILSDQTGVIATMAHEIAHELLLGSGLMSGDESDHEQVTDLLVVALGMGTFQANSAVRAVNGKDLNWEFFRISSLGYLSARVCGYAMGVMEWLGQPLKAPSTEGLGADAAGAMREGFRYLQKTNDCLINLQRPEQLRPLQVPTSDTDLHGMTASQLFALLDSGISTGSSSPLDIQFAQRCLNHKESAIQLAALDLLIQVENPDSKVVDMIVSHLYSKHESVQRRAIKAVGELNLPLSHVTNQGETLLDLLFLIIKNPANVSAVEAAVSLGLYGAQVHAVAPQVLALLVRHLQLNTTDVEPVFDSLRNIVGDVYEYLKVHPYLLPQGHKELIIDFTLEWNRLNREADSGSRDHLDRNPQWTTIGGLENSVESG